MIRNKYIVDRVQTPNPRNPKWYAVKPASMYADEIRIRCRSKRHATLVVEQLKKYPLGQVLAGIPGR